MKITYDLNLKRFQAWGGGIPTLGRVKEHGKCRELEAVLEELYPDGMTETELNNLLWFDAEEVFKWCGIIAELSGKLCVSIDNEDEIKEAIADGDESFTVEGTFSVEDEFGATHSVVFDWDSDSEEIEYVSEYVCGEDDKVFDEFFDDKELIAAVKEELKELGIEIKQAGVKNEAR